MSDHEQSQTDAMSQLQAIREQLQLESQNRQNAEKALQTSEERLRKIFEHSNDAIFVIDPKRDRVLEANPKASQLLGYSRDELINSVRVSTIHPEEMEQVRAFGDKVLKQGFGWTNELTCLTKSGCNIPSEISASVIPFEGQNCIISLVRDVTERKLAEEALKRSESRFRTFVENAADMFFLIGPEGKIEDVNQRSCDVLGYSRQELVELAVTDIDVELNIEKLENLKEKLSHEKPTTIESWHRRKDGTVFPVEVNISRFGSEDYPREIALARDITERKQAQAAMARLAEVGELAAMIVHEVRSPLTTVLMGLESFQNLELSDRHQMRLNLALEEGERLQKLLNEILQYAREQKLELVDIDLVTFISDLKSSIEELPEAKGRFIEIHSSVAEAWIRGDRDKLKQVFINLVRNALEAIPEGETVTWGIEAANLPQHLRVSIHNGGDPIPEEILQKLGSPFFTTKSQGNGLGVAIAKRIVEAHQGEFAIYSTAEEGTTAEVVLPQVR